MARNLILVMVLLLSSMLTISAQQEETKERIIYIPYEQLEKVISKTDKGIYLPYNDYKRLLEEVERARSKPQEIPDMVLVSDVTYDCQVTESFLEVKASYRLNSLKEGWHSVTLGFQNTFIKQAELDNQPAFLKINGSSYELLFKSDAPSQHRLTVNFVVPIVLGKSLDATVNFQVPRAAIAHLNLVIPNAEKKIKVNIEPSLTSQTEHAGSTTTVKALLGNTNSIKINWQSQAERKVEIKQIVHAENHTHLKIGEDFLNIQSNVHYDVIQGQITSLAVKIPEGFNIFSVNSKQGVGIRDWTLQNETLQVNLLSELTDQGKKVDLELEIRLEKIIKKLSGKFSVPVLEVENVEREKGFYTIFLNSDLHTLKIIDRKDISQIDLNDKELAQHIAANQTHFAFKYLKRPFVLNVELEKIDPEYEILSYISAYIDETLYKINSRFTYNIKKSRIFQTQIEIPEDFMILNVKAYDHATRSNINQVKEHVEKQTEDNKRSLLITFKTGMNSSKLSVHIDMQKKFAEQDVREIDLPVFRVHGAKRETGNFGIGVKSSFNITTIEKSQKNVFPMDVHELYSNAQGERPPVTKINIGLRYFDHPIATKFKIEKRDPFVTAEVFDYISITENMLKHEFQVFYTVKYTGVKKFSFTLPKEVAEKVSKSQISDQENLIKEINKEEQEDKKTVLYTIHTHRDVLGDYKVNVAYEEKLERIETSATTQIPVFELITQETNSENGFLVFKKNNNFSLKFSDVKLLEPADVNDRVYSKRGDTKDVSEIFKYSSHGYTLSMLLRKLQFEEVLNTVINRLHLVTTVNKNFTTQNEAIVLLVNNRKQFLDFEIPEGCKVTSVARLKTIPSQYSNPSHIAHQNLEPITPSIREDGKGYRVNITSNVKKNAPLVLVITYSDSKEKEKMGYRGQFTLNPITFGSVPVTYFTWDLGLPTEYQYVKFDSDLTRKYPNYYGVWHGLFGVYNVDTQEIKQDAETGVIPVYDIQGKLFSFSKLNGDGYVTVNYIYRNWLNTLFLGVFVFTCLLIVIVPKLKIMSHLNLVLTLSAVALLLNTLNLQGYQDIYLVVLVGAWSGGAGVLGHRLVKWTGNSLSSSSKKPHTLYKETATPEKAPENTADNTTSEKPEEPSSEKE